MTGEKRGPGRPPAEIANVRRIFTMSPEDAARMAALRVRLGLTSDAAVVRKLIRDAARAAENAGAGPKVATWPNSPSPPTPKPRGN